MWRHAEKSKLSRWGIFCLVSWMMILSGVEAGEKGKAPQPKRFQNGVVAADHPAASQAGLEILKQGGNAIDAAVATSFALSVVRPGSCGIGGGGFMLIRTANDQQVTVFDYRERAPGEATEDMFQTKNIGRQPPELRASRVGAQAVGIPGTVAGLCAVHQRFGTLKLEVVLAPALKLCDEGIVPDHHTREVQANLIQLFNKYPGLKSRFRVLWKRYLHSGNPWRSNVRFYSPQKKILQKIATDGPDAFYQGEVAEAIVRESQKRGGLITLNDLASYEPVERLPLKGEFAGYQIYAMPPPSSGGIALLQILGTLEAYRAQHSQWWDQHAKSGDPQFSHLIVEAMKHAFADRAHYLGDTDYYPVPVAKLLDPVMLSKRSENITFQGTKPTSAYGNHVPVEDAGTSHFSVMDQAGNVVACTETINTAFGSLLVIPEYGIVLNNEMDDFAAVPGEPNAFGLVQSEANGVKAFKKPLSSMSPTIVFNGKKPVMAVGGSGGPKIISATLQVILQRLLWKKEIEEAVAAPRLHHQWLPDRLLLEPGLMQQQAGSLLTLGHQVESIPASAAVQGVVKDERGFSGSADPRKTEQPQASGY